MSSDQSGAADKKAGDNKKMHDKRNGANRAKAGQDFRVLKSISETGIEFQPQLHSPHAAQIALPSRLADGAKPLLFGVIQQRLGVIMQNHCLTEKSVVPLKKIKPWIV